ncbi:MAG: N-acetylmuramoyl-L-alanine amidase, partial [Lachnospiraceae bacterium]|nr:N-acetylmuramoyl-L-alanine amidase [Lachnospiraceae bacterium]MCI9101153.1 N-acetylmuramoyl-L-alanine amidase [Lachnospiraceae bacterium]
MPGHGGADPGAVSNDRQEKDDTLRLALAVGNILKNSGVDVEYTRTTDIYQTPFQKATIANQSGADYFVSFHRNSSPIPGQYTGVETLVYDKSGIKYDMAENIAGALGELGFQNLGVKERPGLVVLRRT